MPETHYITLEVSPCATSYHFHTRTELVPISSSYTCVAPNFPRQYRKIVRREPEYVDDEDEGTEVLPELTFEDFNTDFEEQQVDIYDTTGDEDDEAWEVETASTAEFDPLSWGYDWEIVKKQVVLPQSYFELQVGRSPLACGSAQDLAVAVGWCCVKRSHNCFSWCMHTSTTTTHGRDCRHE